MVEIADKAHAQASQALAASARIAEQAGDMDRALGFYRGLAEVEPNNPVWAFHCVRVLNRSGRGSEAAEALKKAMRKWPRAAARKDIQALVPEVNPTEAQHRAALGQDCPPDAVLRRPPIADDGMSDCIVGRGGRPTAVLLFTGLADRLVMPLPTFDRYLAELDLTAIFLRDRKRIGFFDGVASLGDDYDQTIARLQIMLRDLGVDTVHTIGNSAGGMAAVSYGIDLEAKTVLGFSAPVSLTRATADLDRRTARFAERIVGMVPEERRNLRKRLEDAARPPAVHLYYGKEMPEDRHHAEALEGAPGVTLYGLEGLAGHGALFRMAETNGLRNLFREMFGEAD